VDNPNLIGELHRVDHAKGAALKRQSNLEDARARAVQGFAKSALPPSAAIVKAPRHID